MTVFETFVSKGRSNVSATITLNENSQMAATLLVEEFGFCESFGGGSVRQAHFRGARGICVLTLLQDKVYFSRIRTFAGPLEQQGGGDT
jgi:hypothetical protein